MNHRHRTFRPGVLYENQYLLWFGVEIKYFDLESSLYSVQSYSGRIGDVIFQNSSWSMVSQSTVRPSAYLAKVFGWHSKIGSFNKRTHFNHLNTGIGHNLDPLCILHSNTELVQDPNNKKCTL